MQVPYGIFIAISILTCVFLNDKFASKGSQTRCYFILLFLLPNISGSFGLGKSVRILEWKPEVV